MPDQVIIYTFIGVVIVIFGLLTRPIKAPADQTEARGIPGVFLQEEIDEICTAFPEATHLRDLMADGSEEALAVMRALYDEVLDEFDPDEVIRLLDQVQPYAARQLLLRVSKARRLKEMAQEFEEWLDAAEQTA